jgi:hypothetical protein
MDKIVPQEIVDDFSDRMELAFESGNWKGLPFKPKSSCKLCWGRGHLGFREIRVKPTSQIQYPPQRVFCSCLEKNINQYFDSADLKVLLDEYLSRTEVESEFSRSSDEV